jgi:hypothetical protein
MISIRRTLAGLTNIQPGINYHYPPFSGKGLYHLAHPQFFVLVGIQAGGIRIIRLGGIIVF